MRREVSRHGGAQLGRCGRGQDGNQCERQDREPPTHPITLLATTLLPPILFQKYRQRMYSWQRAMLPSIMGKASRVNFAKLNSTPIFSANPAATKFGLAPTKVPLPPRQAPSASDHQIG